MDDQEQLNSSPARLTGINDQLDNNFRDSNAGQTNYSPTNNTAERERAIQNISPDDELQPVLSPH